MLVAKKITKRYKGNSYDSVKEFTYHFPEKGLVILTGPSGSGKTTLLNILSGNDTKYEGNLEYDGLKINRFNRASYLSRISSIVFQDLNLIPSINIQDNLRIAYESAGKEYDKADCMKLLERVHLPDTGESFDEFVNRDIDSLSGGQRQRLAIARALIKSTKILFLDEPSAALDEDNSLGLSSIFQKLSKDMLVILSTHLPSIFVTENSISLHIKQGVILESEERSEPILWDDDRYGKLTTLSFRSLWSLAKSFFSHSIGKMVCSLVLTIITLSCFLGLTTLCTADVSTILLKDQYKHDNPIALIHVNSEPSQQCEEQDIFLSNFSREQRKTIETIDAHNVMEIGLTRKPIEKHNSGILEKRKEKNLIDNSFFTGKLRFYGLEMWDEFDLYLSQDRRVVDLPGVHDPNDLYEGAISSLMADCIVSYHNERNHNNPIKAQDLIGTKIRDFTICNIYHTADEKRYQSVFNDFSALSEDKQLELQETYSIPSYYSFFFVCPGYVEKFEKEGLTRPLDSYYKNETYIPEASNYFVFNTDYDLRFARKAMRSLDAEIDGVTYKTTLLSFQSKKAEFVSFFADDNMGDYRNKYILYGIIAILLLISTLSLFALFSSNAKKERYSYGILRSLGFSMKSILTSLLFNALLQDILVLFSTLLLCQIFFTTMNVIMGIRCLWFTWLPLLSALAILLLITLLYSASSLLRIKKANTIELLAKKYD